MCGRWDIHQSPPRCLWRSSLHNLLQRNNLDICQKSIGFVNAARKSKVDDNTAKMQSIKWLGV